LAQVSGSALRPPMLSAVLAGVLVQAACPPPGFSSTSSFDLDAYIAQPWHIQQQMPLPYLPAEYNHCVTASYRKKAKPSFFGYEIGVLNYAQNAEGKPLGPLTEICAKVVNESMGQLKVAPCFLPSFLAGPYWILEFNDEEGWAIVSGGPPTQEAAGGCRTGSGTNGSGLWLFTRKRERDEALLQKLRALAAEKGFDLSVLIDVVQTNCENAPVMETALVV